MRRLVKYLVRRPLFYSEELLPRRPTPKLEDHPFSAVRDCLFSLFAATLHIGDRSYIRNIRTRHAVLTGTHLPFRTRHAVLTGTHLPFRTRHAVLTGTHLDPLNGLHAV
jgi:hypothetical protein